MQAKMSNKFYLVEDNKAVKFTDNGILEIEPYTKKITINQVKDILKRYVNFTEFKEFEDKYIFKGNTLDISVITCSESNFYDTPGDINIKNYLERVENIFISVNKLLSSDNLRLIGNLMNAFHLNIYSFTGEKYYTNIKELKQGMTRLGLL